MNISSCHLNHKFKIFNMISQSLPSVPQWYHPSPLRFLTLKPLWTSCSPNFYFPKADACVVPSAWNNYLFTLQLSAIHSPALGLSYFHRQAFLDLLFYSFSGIFVFFLPHVYHELWSCICICVSLLKAMIVFVLMYFLSPVHYLVHKNDP